MTAETLKPFITPQNVESCPTAHSGTATTRRLNILAIGLSTISLVLLTAVLGYTIWLSMRVHNTETENARLNRVINGLQDRLGIHYLDDMKDFEKEYANALIEDPSSLDDLEGDYDYDEDDDDGKGISIVNVDKDDDESDEDDNDDSMEKLETYDEIQEYIRKISGYDNNDDDDDDEDIDEVTANNHDDSSSTSEDYNLYGDFEKYKDSKKKKESARVARSITHLPDELSPHDELKSNETKNAEKNMKKIDSTPSPTYKTHTRTDNSGSSTMKKTHFVADKTKNQRYTLLRQRSHRQRKMPVVKNGESLLSAKYTSPISQAPAMPLNTIKPAAHFHLNRKVPERHGAIRVESYPGDMYIGHHPSWSNEMGTEHYFSIQNGVLTVREPGLYYVYAQICYNNTHDQNGFVIFHGHKPFLQCLNTVPTNLPLKIHTCHTSGLIYLRENESIHLRDFHSERNVILKDSNNRSYFGLIKI